MPPEDESFSQIKPLSLHCRPHHRTAVPAVVSVSPNVPPQPAMFGGSHAFQVGFHFNLVISPRQNPPINHGFCCMLSRRRIRTPRF